MYIYMYILPIYICYSFCITTPFIEDLTLPPLGISSGFHCVATGISLGCNGDYVDVIPKYADRTRYSGISYVGVSENGAYIYNF